MALNQDESSRKSYDYNAEEQAVKGRRKSRLGTLTDDQEKLDVSGQIELEEGNAIKYRTCSWQKVNPLLPCRDNRSRLCAMKLVSNREHRLPRFYSRSTYVWPSCRFRTHIPSSDSCLVSL